jgi:hypothetical protein
VEWQLFSFFLFLSSAALCCVLPSIKPCVVLLLCHCRRAGRSSGSSTATSCSSALQHSAVWFPQTVLRCCFVTAGERAG